MNPLDDYLSPDAGWHYISDEKADEYIVKAKLAGCVHYQNAYEDKDESWHPPGDGPPFMYRPYPSIAWQFNPSRWDTMVEELTCDR